MRWRRALAGVIGVLLALDAGALVVIDDDAPAPEVARRRSPPAGRPIDDSPLAPVIAAVSTFVETSRGLQFKRPVRARLLDGEAFDAAYLGTGGDTAAFEIERTLGLIHPDQPVSELAAEAARDVVGFYDPEAETLYVRGSEPTPQVRVTLAHELTHALQDQHFELDRGEAFGVDNEADIGLVALAEGDALRVEQAYIAALSPDDQHAVAADDPDPNAALPPADENAWPGDEASTFLGVFPYVAGKRLVDELVTRGGQAALDEAFRNPPATTAELYPPRPGDPAPPPHATAPVADPSADGDIIARRPFGALHLDAFLLAQWGEADRDWQPEAWRGGRFVAWRSGDTTCVRFTVAVDSAPRATYLVDLFETAAAVHGRATVAGRLWEENPYLRQHATNQRFGPITYTACGPPQSRNLQQATEVVSGRHKRFFDSYQRRTASGEYSPPPTRPTPYSPPPTSPPPTSAWEPATPTTTTTRDDCAEAGVVEVCG